MTNRGQSTIAQLVFPPSGSLDFARIVSELESVLSRLRGDEVEIEWDCDDLVTFDIPGTRILLAWSEVARRCRFGCLTVSVGPGLVPRGDYEHADHEILCSRLVERIQTRFDPTAVLWCLIDGGVDAEQVDTLVEELPDMGADLPPVDSILDSLSRTDAFMATRKAAAPSEAMLERTMRAAALAAQRRVLPKIADIPSQTKATQAALQPDGPNSHQTPPGEAANDTPDLPPMQLNELYRLREALYPVDLGEEQVVYSTQMRLAAHCMNATLILVWAPLGAAVMTYSVLRGENMRLSSRLMAMSGTVFALAHSPIGETMAAMAQGLV